MLICVLRGLTLTVIALLSYSSSSARAQDDRFTPPPLHPKEIVGVWEAIEVSGPITLFIHLELANERTSFLFTKIIGSREYQLFKLASRETREDGKLILNFRTVPSKTNRSGDVSIEGTPRGGGSLSMFAAYFSLIPGPKGQPNVFLFKGPWTRQVADASIEAANRIAAGRH